MAAKEERQKADLRRRVAQEADQAKEEIGKQVATDSKVVDSKKLQKLIKSSAAESFTQMLHNESSRRIFESYLNHQTGTADDLNFYLKALEFREQLYMSKEQERKVALRYMLVPPLQILFISRASLISVVSHQVIWECQRIVSARSSSSEIVRWS